MVKLYPHLRARTFMARTFFLLLSLYFTTVAHAQRFAVSSGNWSDAIWAATATGAAGSAAVPGAADAVIINGGVTVTVGGIAAGSLAVPTSLTISSGAVLDMGTYELAAAAITNNGTLRTQSTSPVALPRGITWGGTVSYDAASEQFIATGQYNNLSIAGGSRIFGAGETAIAGVFITDQHSVALGGSSLHFNGTAAQTVPSWNYTNLRISGAHGNSNITFAPGNVGISGTLSLDATFGNGSYVLSSPSTFVFQGTATQEIPANGRLSYQNLTVFNTAAPVHAGGMLTVNGTLLVDKGATLDMGSYPLGGALSKITINGLLRGTVSSSSSAEALKGQELR
ncbi:MAG: hypothetical protein EOP50_03005 [Sphingobacteriales bacterium]|nr:MAG: hypothetical protein EOP50_03005 [Sphingobacteriales bacterium]